MSRMTDNDKHWGPFTWGPWHHRISITWSSGGGDEEDPRNYLLLTGFGKAIRVWLPRILRPWAERHIAVWDEETVKRMGRNWYDTFHPREYGISLSNMGNGYDFFQVDFGAQTMDSRTTQDWCCHLPWKQWDCVRHSMYHPDGSHYFTEPRDRKGMGNWDAWWKARQECPVVHFAFEDYDGAKRIASCHIEEREWHRGVRWFKWLKWFWPAKIRRSLDLEFDYEIGPEKGSWKGGTIGHGIDMLPNETPEQAFMRYCEMNHSGRGGRTYKIKYVGPCGPPEPHEIRVARNRGWKQCDYPHSSAKDMWYHPDSEACPDGKYISTEEMLEAIQEEHRKHNEACGMALKKS